MYLKSVFVDERSLPIPVDPNFLQRVMTGRLIHDAEELVKDRMSAYDSSHDWHHVNRVRKQGSFNFPPSKFQPFVSQKSIIPRVRNLRGKRTCLSLN